LVGKLVPVFQAKTVVVQTERDELAENYQHPDVKENRETIALVSAGVGEIAEPIRPPGGDEHNQECEPQR
jgi:hypothetical protein